MSRTIEPPPCAGRPRPALLASLFALVLSALALGPGAARAQTEEELAAARATFMEGVELTNQEQWAEAAARFREVLAVRATGQVRFNLGVALSHTEERAEAARQLELALATDELDRRTRRTATSMLAELMPQLGRLQVTLTGDEGGAEVRLDGAPLPLDAIGQARLIEPGEHEVSVERNGASVARASATVVAGETASVTLMASPPGSLIDPELLAHEEPAEEPSGGGDVTGEWWFWTAILAGAVLVGGAIVIGVVVASDGTVSPFQGNLDPGFLEVMP